MKIINLTQHEVNVKERKIESSGVCRCEEIISPVGKIDGIQIIKKMFGKVTGLPEEKADTIYIVSLPIAQAVKGFRDDCYIPGVLIRDEKGRIIGCENIAII